MEKKRVSDRKMSKYGLGNYSSINAYVKGKIKALVGTDKHFSDLYNFMFSEGDNVFAERTDGHRIITTTYAQAKARAEKFAAILNEELAEVEKGEIVGLHMNNCEEWIELFWAILKCGYRPLLMNMRLDYDRLCATLSDCGAKAVVSDGRTFPCKTLLADELVQAESGEYPAVNGENFADEIIVMSSGTSDKVKLCGYTGRNFVCQIQDSANIIRKCKQIKKHYNYKIKLLAFLPLYHIFGLAAMYMWFGFYSRTFVFLKDLNPDTILYTIKKHKVTHIFAVPLLWNKVYEGLYKKLAEMGEKTEKKFAKGLKIAQKTGSKTFSKLAFGEVRKNLFGDSVKFMITGGSAISPAVLGLFNAIGYPLANGYGMSEVGITSVELSASSKKLFQGSVGKPFSHIEYSVNADGELLVRGESTATRIWEGGKETVIAGTAYNTKDIVSVKKGRYYILGRKDDMIVEEGGENINPDYAESRMNVEGASGVAIIKSQDSPVLLVSVNKYASGGKRKAVTESARRELEKLGMSSQVRTVALVESPLMEENEFKLNRRRLAAAYASGELAIADAGADAMQRGSGELYSAVRAEFAAALGKSESDIGDDMHFFFDLGGSSLDYFTLVSNVRKKFGVNFPVTGNESPATVRKFCEYLERIL